MKQLSIKEAFAFTWQTIRTNSLFFVEVVIILAAIQYLPALILPIAPVNIKDPWFFAFVIGLLTVLLGTFISMGIVYATLQALEGKQLTHHHLFSQSALFGQYLLGTIIYILAVAIGSVLLIIPGIIAAVSLMFYDYVVVDKKVMAVDALKQSIQLTKGVRWHLCLLLLIIVGISILGEIIVSGIGTAITTPIILLATGHVYKQLLAISESHVVVSPPASVAVV